MARSSASNFVNDPDLNFFKMAQSQATKTNILEDVDEDLFGSILEDFE